MVWGFLGCISLRDVANYAKFVGFWGVGAIVASFVPTECSGGRGMWGIFGKPLKRAIWNTGVCMLY